MRLGSSALTWGEARGDALGEDPGVLGGVGVAGACRVAELGLLGEAACLGLLLYAWAAVARARAVSHVRGILHAQGPCISRMTDSQRSGWSCQQHAFLPATAVQAWSAACRLQSQSRCCNSFRTARHATDKQAAHQLHC